MAGAMRKMAVYLGLVEDDGYDGRGSTPTTTSSLSWTPNPSGTAGATNRRISRTTLISHISPNGTNRYEWCSLPPSANRFRCPRNPDVRRESPPWHPSHLNARAWRRTHR